MLKQHDLHGLEGYFFAPLIISCFMDSILAMHHLPKKDSGNP